MRTVRHPGLWHMLLYGAVIAALSLLLDWMDFRHAMHRWSSDLYILCVAILFAGLGAWLGRQLTPLPRAHAFVRNHAAIAALGITDRELQVLDHLAEGAPNKLIARRLAISPNTVKTHVARLFGKLGAANRTEAIARARRLDLLP